MMLPKCTLVLLMVCGAYAQLQEWARGKPTEQIDRYGGGGPPSKAVDGNTNNRWPGKSCTHTNAVANAWWGVDLKEKVAVDTVKLYNRGDCCGNRLSNFVVGFVDKPHAQGPLDPKSVKVCARHPGAIGQGASKSIKCGKSGRYLVVQLLGNGRILTLCEVQVFGKKAPGKCVRSKKCK